MRLIEYARSWSNLHTGFRILPRQRFNIGWAKGQQPRQVLERDFGSELDQINRALTEACSKLFHCLGARCSMSFLGLAYLDVFYVLSDPQMTGYKHLSTKKL